MEIIDMINQLCKDKGISLRQMEKRAGLSSGQTSKWKNGFKPNNASLSKVADYFGVSIGYLLGETPMPAGIPSEHDVPNGTVVYHRNGQTVTEHLTPEQLDMLAKMIKAIKMDDNDEL